MSIDEFLQEKVKEQVRREVSEQLAPIKSLPDKFSQKITLSLSDMCEILRLENDLNNRSMIRHTARSGFLPFIIGCTGMEFPTVLIDAWLCGEWSHGTTCRILPAQKLETIEKEVAAKDLSGFVYLFKCKGLYKIGKSKNPKQRLKTLQGTIGAYPIEMIHAFPCADMKQAESSLHRRYSDKRVRGEWFKLNWRSVQSILRINEL